MANFTGVTVSQGFKVASDAQADKLDEILKKYQFSMEDYMLGDDDEFGIWGYDWLNILKAGDENYEEVFEDVSEDFFEELRQIMLPDQKLEVTCVGNEKLRYATAMKVTVTPDKVDFHSF